MLFWQLLPSWLNLTMPLQWSRNILLQSKSVIMKKSSQALPVPPLLQVAEVKVIYQTESRSIEKLKISGSADAEKILRANWSNDIEFIEEFNVLFLNKANQVKGIFRLSRGGLTGTVADIRILYATALKGLCTGILLSHNHPSGCLKPSAQDIELTKKLCAIGKIHDIPILDHLILAPHSGYYSFSDQGML